MTQYWKNNEKFNGILWQTGISKEKKIRQGFWKNLTGVLC